MKYRPQSPSELESIVNRALNLRKTKGSGSVHNDADGKGVEPGVASHVQVMVECKHSDRPTHTISFRHGDFRKTNTSARRHGRIPLMATYNPGIDDVFICMRLKDFEAMYGNHIAHTRTIDD